MTTAHSITNGFAFTTGEFYTRCTCGFTRYGQDPLTVALIGAEHELEKFAESLRNGGRSDSPRPVRPPVRII